MIILSALLFLPSVFLYAPLALEGPLQNPIYFKAIPEKPIYGDDEMKDVVDQTYTVLIKKLTKFCEEGYFFSNTAAISVANALADLKPVSNYVELYNQAKFFSLSNKYELKIKEALSTRQGIISLKDMVNTLKQENLISGLNLAEICIVDKHVCSYLFSALNKCAFTQDAYSEETFLSFWNSLMQSKNDSQVILKSNQETVFEALMESFAFGDELRMEYLKRQFLNLWLGNAFALVVFDPSTNIFVSISINSARDHEPVIFRNPELPNINLVRPKYLPKAEPKTLVGLLQAWDVYFNE